MGNAAIDYEKQDALNSARMQPPKAEDFQHVLPHGRATPYSPSDKAGFQEDVFVNHPEIRRNLNVMNELALARKKGNSAEEIDYNGRPENVNLRNSIKNKAAEAEKYLPNELREKLDKARQNYKEAKQLGGEAKTLVKSLTPWGFFSLIGKIHPLTDAPYFFAIMAAILKDGLDLIGLGSLPVIGTVISSGSSIFTAAMMFLGNVMHAEHDRTVFQSILLKQFGVLLFTTVIEFLFGLNLAPFQTVGVVFIFAFALAARKGRNAIETEN